jgi:hypothetical protein
MHWQHKWQVIQRERAAQGLQPLQGAGGLSPVQHLSFASQRWQSMACPRRRYASLFAAVALVLGHMADDSRADQTYQKDAIACLEAMDGLEAVRAGLAADWSSEGLEFIRLFDRQWHDPATTMSRTRAFIERLRRLVVERRVLSERPTSATMSVSSLTELAVQQIAKPITIYYGAFVKVISLDPGRTFPQARELLARLAFVAEQAITRIQAVAPPECLVASLGCFDLEQWVDGMASPSRGRLLKMYRHGANPSPQPDIAPGPPT